jgi:hypothetical protein
MIKKYDPVVYPRKLWISNDTSKRLQALFTSADKSPLVLDDDESFVAEVLQVRERSTDLLGELLWIRDNMSLIHMAHEATHIAMDILSNVGIQFHADNQEPVAYLIGWGAECISQFCNHKGNEKK